MDVCKAFTYLNLTKKPFSYQNVGKFEILKVEKVEKSMPWKAENQSFGTLESPN